jgi:hypothetical protein
MLRDVERCRAMSRDTIRNNTIVVVQHRATLGDMKLVFRVNSPLFENVHLHFVALEAEDGAAGAHVLTLVWKDAKARPFQT